MADLNSITQKKLISNIEIENIIREKIKTKEPFFKIKTDLQNQGIMESNIDEIFIRIVKVI